MTSEAPGDLILSQPIGDYEKSGLRCQVTTLELSRPEPSLPVSEIGFDYRMRTSLRYPYLLQENFLCKAKRGKQGSQRLSSTTAAGRSKAFGTSRLLMRPWARSRLSPTGFCCPVLYRFRTSTASFCLVLYPLRTWAGNFCPVPLSYLGGEFLSPVSV